MSLSLVRIDSWGAVSVFERFGAVGFKVDENVSSEPLALDLSPRRLRCDDQYKVICRFPATDVKS